MLPEMVKIRTERFRVTPDAYRRITLATLWSLAVIIITGAAVRLTGSGLGCSDWPNCKENQLVASLDYHEMVEFVNRVITGLVSAAVILAVLGSLIRRPRRRDLTWWSFGLVLGVAVQVGLGALVVLRHLSPRLVMSHFLVSMVLIANAVILHRLAKQPDSHARNLKERQGAAPWLRHASKSLVLATAAAVVTGTLLTGAGPHGGDEDVVRFSLHIPTLARYHGAAMILTFVLALFVWAFAERGQGSWRKRKPDAFAGAARRVLLILAVQTFVGYTQYFTDVPTLLVGIHIAGAVGLWTFVLQLHLSVHDRKAVHDKETDHSSGKPSSDELVGSLA